MWLLMISLLSFWDDFSAQFLGQCHHCKCYLKGPILPLCMLILYGYRPVMRDALDGEHLGCVQNLMMRLSLELPLSNQNTKPVEYDSLLGQTFQYWGQAERKDYALMKGSLQYQLCSTFFWGKLSCCTCLGCSTRHRPSRGRRPGCKGSWVEIQDQD